MLPSLNRTATGESGPIIAPETAAPSWLRPPFAVKRPSRRTTAPDGSFNPAWTLSGPVLGTAPCAPNTPKTASATTTPPVIVSATPVAVALKKLVSCVLLGRLPRPYGPIGLTPVVLYDNGSRLSRF